LSASVALEEISAWGNRHSQPIYFYAHFAIYSGIWTPAVIAGLIQPYAKKKIDRFGSYRFIIIWIILTLFVLSIVPEKKERYLLPAMIPMAIMAGSLWRDIFQAFAENRVSIGDRRLLTAHTVFNVIISLAIPILVFRYGVFEGSKMTMPFATSWTVLFVLLAVTIIILHNKAPVKINFMGTLLLMCLIDISILPVFFHSSLCRTHPDPHPLRAIRQIEELKGLKIYSDEQLNLKLIWHSGRPIQQWNYKTQPLPLGNMPIAFISTNNPTQSLLALFGNKMDVTVIEKYPIQFSGRKVVYFITLISPLKKN
jgi:4-amino-4-deoxy-L-arabinose transferase-like glycosyltransferase